MEKVLVLAGGFPQIELIKKLKSRGYFVLLADWNENPVAKEYCDKYYKESTLDVEKIKKIALDEKVKFIITVCTDQALLTVAKVSEELGLPCYIDYETALNVTNKQYMKEVFLKNGIPSAKYVILDDFDSDKLKDFRYPLITKPVDCNSSKGVKKANDELELKKYFYEAKSMSRTNTAIIEEFITGSEITVDVYIENGKAIVLSTSNSEKIADNDKFVIFRTLNPSTPNLDEKIRAIAQQIADAFNLKNTTMLIQMLADGDNVYVIEFSARTGGGVKYILVKDVCGFDVIDAIIDLTEGKKVNAQISPRKYNYISNEFVYCKPGVFDHLEGFEELKQKNIVKDYYLFKHKGAGFDGITNSGDRICGFTVTADSPEELLNKHRMVNSTFKVINNSGEDMARHDLLVDFNIK